MGSLGSRKALMDFRLSMTSVTGPFNLAKRKTCMKLVRVTSGSNDHWESHSTIINLSGGEPEWNGIAFRFPDYGKGLYRQSDFRADMEWADVVEVINAFAERDAPEASEVKKYLDFLRWRSQEGG